MLEHLLFSTISDNIKSITREHHVICYENIATDIVAVRVMGKKIIGSYQRFSMETQTNTSFF